MGEPNKKHKFRIGRKQFIIAIVSVCLVALIAEAILLIHTFSKKGEKARKLKTPREGTVWRVKEARVEMNNYVAVYSFEYDEKGREIRRNIHYDNYDGRTFDATPRETRYLAGGCGLTWFTDFEDSTTTFFTEDPLLVTEEELVTRYEVDERGRFRILETNDIKVNKRWTFDEEGRPIQASASNGQVTRFSYDASGRLVQIERELVILESERGVDAEPGEGTESGMDTDLEQNTESGQDTSDPYELAGENCLIEITYENDTRFVTKTNQNGKVSREEEYVGGRLSQSVAYNDYGDNLWTTHIYYPKGNFILTGTEYRDGYLFSNLDADDFFAISMIEYIFAKYQRVEFTGDQPETLYNADDEIEIKNRYDKNGLLKERLVYGWEGDISEDYLFEFDEYSNLTHVSLKDGSKDYTFEWVEIDLKAD